VTGLEVPARVPRISNDFSAMLPFSIHLRDGEPVSDQIVRAAHRALASGELREGDLFPSVRVMAQELKISPTTAHKVMQQLKDLGFLASRPGVGMVVRAPKVPPLARRLELLAPSARRFLAEARDLHLSIDELAEFLRHLDRGESGKPEESAPSDPSDKSDPPAQ
jgi:DNA-binding transcriptional regulator YhcF (GntR family)